MMNWKGLGPTHCLAQGASPGQPADQRDTNGGECVYFSGASSPDRCFLFLS